MKLSKGKIKNIVFFTLIGLLLIPQTRQPIQVLLHKSLALFSPSIIDESNQIIVEDYNWILKDESGLSFNFKSTKGKVVLINFWATWCPPCIAEMSSMQALYEDYKDVVEFVFVSDEKFSVISKFMNEKEYTFKVYKPISEYPNKFNISSIPRTFLIDKSGRIIIDKTGAANWNSESVKEVINDLLK
ncbi:thiol-disulfide oxidoreductase [Algibacter marinivivus]|uniref:Thiol-disulfide oxidoreductase n=1 Tax=Algibacter marinivivus TaxID=2100723 RepID=A0A2U2X5F1_9FLAO|nr:TlpA disulfide reductase family protein [Algibacter marinivivus]PWH83001.1 thiol-disulfide oxidoreductase [Algibacter marinivivus]